jgi:signal transduction histidine kinase
MAAENSRATRQRISVRDELARVYAESASSDEFVHALMGFLVELSEAPTPHPVVNALAEELGRASTARFTALAVHDLRSMLQGVSVSLDYAPKLLERSGLLAEGRGPIDPKPLGMLLEAIEDARTGTRMAAELARETLVVHRNHAHANQCRLNDVVESTVRLGQRLAPIDIALETSAALEVGASPSNLFRVLVNLLRNAVQAIGELEHSEGASVRVSSWASDELAFVQVSDDGPGIPSSVRDQLFDLFFTTHAEGTGIGLYVCKSIVTGWGGMIHVDGHEGEGARFTFSIPIAESAARDRRR